MPGNPAPTATAIDLAAVLLFTGNRGEPPAVAGYTGRHAVGSARPVTGIISALIEETRRFHDHHGYPAQALAFFQGAPEPRS